MRNLQEATEKICDLKGSVLALDAVLSSLLARVPTESRSGLLAQFADNAELVRTVLLHADISDHTIAAFERDVARFAVLIGQT